MTQTQIAARRSRAIPVRAPRFHIDVQRTPRNWLAGNLRASHVVDALSLVFPEGERFLIRSVKHYLAAVEDDPELMANVRGFFGQEGRHGHEHDRHNRMLREHGYDTERFLRLYEKIFYGMIEPATPPVYRLATTVAIEHVTATLAEIALTTGVLDEADPEVRRLLYWHAAEEIEHRSVAFDVLARIDPRMRTRLVGLGIGTAVLALAFVLAYAILLEGEAELPPVADDAAGGRRFAREAQRAVPIVAQAITAFLRRDFHPEHGPGAGLAEEALARAGVETPGR